LFDYVSDNSPYNSIQMKLPMTGTLDRQSRWGDPLLGNRRVQNQRWPRQSGWIHTIQPISSKSRDSSWWPYDNEEPTNNFNRIHPMGIALSTKSH